MTSPLVDPEWGSCDRNVPLGERVPATGAPRVNPDGVAGPAPADDCPDGTDQAAPDGRDG